MSSKYRADEGDGITVTSVPDVGYRLESVTVKNSESATDVMFTEYLEDGDSTFTFTMPAAASR